jgi:ribosomal protein L40E
MPVKVKCPSCEKLLNAPDAARGKAVKCPGCETRIPVPAADGLATGGGRLAVKPKKKASSDQDSMEFLANVDMSRAVDSSASICPKCGADIPDDASECPKCGVDPATGLLTEAAKKRLARKGIDPAKFFEVVWKDSWEFTKENKRTVLRSILYAVLSYGIVAGCGFMVSWCTRMPPRTFWMGFLVVAWQIFPGWIWHLRAETIRLTIAKKRDLRDVHFDLFQNVALGIKTILWTAAFCWMPGTFLMFPLAMIHMAMPVTKRAWSWPLMLATFFRNLKPTLYYWVIHIVMDIPLYIAAAIVAGLFGKQALGMYQAAMAGQEVKPPSWVFIAVVSVIGALSLVWFSFASVFMMRVTALIAFYYRDNLDLVTRVPEKTYVHREIKVDAFGVPLRTKEDKIKDNILAVIAVIVICIVAWLIYRQLFPANNELDLPRPEPPAEAAAPGA